MEATTLIAGLLQGLLEWLPVSSSGQLLLYYTSLLGLPLREALQEAYAAHLGTAASAAIIAWHGVVRVFREWRMFRAVLVPTVSAAPLGLAIIKLLSAEASMDVLNAVLGIALLATGALLHVAGGGRGEGARSFQQLGVGELVAVGLAEGAAALPGLSRSGTVLAVLLLLRVKPAEAVEATLILGIPVTLAASLYAGSSIPASDAAVLAAASLLSGLLSAKIMLELAARFERDIPKLLAVLGALILLLTLPPLIG